MSSLSSAPGIAIALTAGGIALAACGGIDSHVFDETPIFESGGDDTQSEAEAATDVPEYDGGTVDLATVCGKLVEVICGDALKVCCAKRGLGYSDGNCKELVNADCEANVADAKADKVKFDATRFGACASSLIALEAACTVPVLTFIKRSAACSGLFSGPTGAGGACSRASECAAPAGIWATCTGSRCATVAVVGDGETCLVHGSARRLCDAGYACLQGTCKRATPLDGRCEGATDTACGFGRTCAAGKCAPGAAGGASCVSELQCASGDCSRGHCTDPEMSVVSTALCNGG